MRQLVEPEHPLGVAPGARGQPLVVDPAQVGQALLGDPVVLASALAGDRPPARVHVPDAFQAVQHLLADALVRTEGARAATRHAAWAVDELDPADDDRVGAARLFLAGSPLDFEVGALDWFHGGETSGAGVPASARGADVSSRAPTSASMTPMPSNPTARNSWTISPRPTGRLCSRSAQLDPAVVLVEDVDA